MVEPHEEMKEILEGDQDDQDQFEDLDAQSEDQKDQSDSPEQEQVDASQGGAEPQQKTVPIDALHATRKQLQEAKGYKDQFEQSQQELNAMRQQMQMIQQMQMMQPQQRSQEEKQPDINIWDDPQAYMERYTQSIEKKFESRLNEQRMQFSKMSADSQYGADLVSKAEQELLNYANSNPAGHQEFLRIQQSSMPYHEAVQWYKQRQVMQAIGDDPNAWIEKQKEALLDDPEFLAKALERSRLQAGMPQNGGQPNINLPPKIKGSSKPINQISPDDSDDDIFEEL